MTDGFLGYHASFMLDVVVCALALVVPALIFSLYLVKFRRNFVWHRNMQVTLGIVLLVTVGAFEIDLQIVHDGWEEIVENARGQGWVESVDFSFVQRLLWIHLVFAISTPVLWATTLVLALKRFPTPPRPSEHSRLHKMLGWASAVDITLTSITGLIFYYHAFISAG